MNTLQTAGMECAQCANPRLKGMHTCVHGFFDNNFNFQTAGAGMDSADALKELIARQAVEIERLQGHIKHIGNDALRSEVERKRKLMQSLLNVLKLDRHDVEDWPKDSRLVIAAITKELTP